MTQVAEHVLSDFREWKGGSNDGIALRVLCSAVVPWDVEGVHMVVLHVLFGIRSSYLPGRVCA